MLLLDGEVCIEMPNSLSEARLQYCTTQRLGGILKVVYTKQIFGDFSLLTKLHRKLATMFGCDANMASLPIWLTSAWSFFNRAMADSQNQETTSK